MMRGQVKEAGTPQLPERKHVKVLKWGIRHSPAAGTVSGRPRA